MDKKVKRPILIDVTRLAGRYLEGRIPTGVDRVSLEYIRHFASHAQALIRFGGRWLVLAKQDSRSLFQILLKAEGMAGAHIRWLVAKAYALKWQPPLPGSILINVGHSGLDRDEYVHRVRQYGLLPLYLLHDLIPIEFPEYCRPGEANRHRKRMWTALSSGHGLVMNSRVTSKVIEAYAESSGLSVPPTTIAHLAPSIRFSSSLKKDYPPLRDPYFVVLSTIEPRKNHLLLLNIWRDLVWELGSRAPKLVLIGQRGWECEQVIDMLERCNALKGVVLEVNGCSDEQLAVWLYHARALLFPSFAEGFGLPLIEALSLETPVIASDLSVFRELADEIPEYLHPLDGLGWKQAIKDFVVENHPRRMSQKSRMAGWRLSTWDEHFHKVESFIIKHF